MYCKESLGFSLQDYLWLVFWLLSIFFTFSMRRWSIMRCPSGIVTIPEVTQAFSIYQYRDILIFKQLLNYTVTIYIKQNWRDQESLSNSTQYCHFFVHLCECIPFIPNIIVMCISQFASLHLQIMIWFLNSLSLVPMNTRNLSLLLAT